MADLTFPACVDRMHSWSDVVHQSDMLRSGLGFSGMGVMLWFRTKKLGSRISDLVIVTALRGYILKLHGLGLLPTW